MDFLRGMYEIFTDKLLFFEWLLSINVSIGRNLTMKIARIEADDYVESQGEMDLRKAPPSVKKNRIYDADVLEERWNLCLGCEYLTDDWRCRKCGCPMMAKHKLAHAKCPIGKWDRYAN